MSWTGSVPAVQHLRTFGSIAHMKVTAPNQRKLDDRSKRTIFVGYEPSSKAYRVYDPVTRRVHVSRDVVFEEAAQWSWTEGQQSGAADFVIENLTLSETTTTTTTTSTSTPARTVAASLGSPAPSAYASPVHATGNATPRGHTQLDANSIEFVSPPGAGASQHLDADHDSNVPLRYRAVDNILGPATHPGLAARELEEQLLLASEAEPTSFKEAMEQENWRHAMLDEFTSIEANDTWELVDPVPGVRPIGLKWVYKTKRDEAGLVTKFKARLVAKGYV